MEMLRLRQDSLSMTDKKHDWAVQRFFHSFSVLWVFAEMARPRVSRGWHEVYYARGVVAPYVGPQLAPHHAVYAYTVAPLAPTRNAWQARIPVPLRAGCAKLVRGKNSGNYKGKKK